MCLTNRCQFHILPHSFKFKIKSNTFLGWITCEVLIRLGCHITIYEVYCSLL